MKIYPNELMEGSPLYCYLEKQFPLKNYSIHCLYKLYRLTDDEEKVSIWFSPEYNRLCEESSPDMTIFVDLTVKNEDERIFYKMTHTTTFESLYKLFYMKRLYDTK